MELSATEAIRTKYGIGQKFAELYIKQWFGQADVNESTVRAALQDPMKMLWFEFALSTNWRGEKVLETLKEYIPTRPGRYLDVGSAFGGFLVAFGRAGYEVTGLEPDQRLSQFASANLSDQGISANIIQGDILNPELLPQLGKFDVITCNDVIEHVADVPKTLEHMAGLLKPGGILLMQMPNKDSLRFVAHDGHYNLFGITLLRRADALEYYDAHHLGNAYDVGEYFRIDEYRDWLKADGCDVQVLPPPTVARFRSTPRLVLGILKSYLQYFRTRRRQIPPRLNRLLDARLFGYLWEVGSHATAALFSGRRAEQFHSFRLTYLAEAWLVLAKKL